MTHRRGYDQAHMIVDCLLQIMREDDPERMLRLAGRHLLSLTGADAAVVAYTGGRSETNPVYVGSLTSAIRSQFGRWYRRIVQRDAPLESIRRREAGITLIALPYGEQCHAAVAFRSTAQVQAQPVVAAVRPFLDVLGAVLALRTELEAAQKANERLEHLYETGKSLASTLDLNELLYNTIQLAAEAVNAEAASVITLDPATNDLVFQTAHGEKRDELRKVRLATTEGIAGWVFQHGEPTIVNNPQHDPRFAQQVDARTGFTTRSILCVPLQVKGRTIGVLQVLNKHAEAGFDREDVTLLLPLAGEAAVAIENAQLYQNLREERDRIVEAQEEVRRELARDLHDGTVQLLSSIIMSLNHVRQLIVHDTDMAEQELEYVEDLAQRTLRETRTLLFELRPVTLETRGLAAALDSYVERLNRSEVGPPVTVYVEDGVPQLPSTVARTLFALIQEAVNNARKHAEAERIDVRIRISNDCLMMTVTDDGCGFDLASVQRDYDQSGSLGLLNMRERAALIDAYLDIDCAPGEGTTVSVKLPLTDVATAQTEGIGGSDEPST